MLFKKKEKKEKVTSVRPDIQELELITEENGCLPFLLGIITTLIAYLSYVYFNGGF